MSLKFRIEVEYFIKTLRYLYQQNKCFTLSKSTINVYVAFQYNVSLAGGNVNLSKYIFIRVSIFITFYFLFLL